MGWNCTLCNSQHSHPHTSVCHRFHIPLDEPLLRAVKSSKERLNLSCVEGWKCAQRGSKMHRDSGATAWLQWSHNRDIGTSLNLKMSLDGDAWRQMVGNFFWITTGRGFEKHTKNKNKGHWSRTKMCLEGFLNNIQCPCATDQIKCVFCCTVGEFVLPTHRSALILIPAGVPHPQWTSTLVRVICQM